MNKDICLLCPRKCAVNRTVSQGFCSSGDKIRVARIGLHLWEEPCISYGKGSGTVFFSGCNLKCVFCQNREISFWRKGKDISTDTLAYEFLRLQDIGASNINLVTPTHFAVQIMRALDKVKHKLTIPVCYNSSGYESAETIRQLKGYIEIFIPDFKYFSSEYAKRYSGAENYFEAASGAIKQMHENVGYAEFDDDMHLKKGVLVRHLVLPGLYKDSIDILEYLAKTYDSSKLAISIMSQFFPTEECTKFPEINRRITSLEYKKVVDKATELGFVNGFIQEKSSASEKYVPDFDY